MNHNVDRAAIVVESTTNLLQCYILGHLNAECILANQMLD